ncbi:hypothetical protein [Paraburkholderia hospita]|uniref:hypothetical protein n=1 Tax=Paraburkholderia hospita TaxID=169430 RepID=UPI0013F16892|nr:hypothetical protein [Paraburkholderia hospita]
MGQDSLPCVSEKDEEHEQRTSGIASLARLRRINVGTHRTGSEDVKTGSVRIGSSPFWKGWPESSNRSTTLPAARKPRLLSVRACTTLMQMMLSAAAGAASTQATLVLGGNDTADRPRPAKATTARAFAARDIGKTKAALMIESSMLKNT